MADFQIPSELEKRLFVSDKKLAKKLVAKLDDFADLLVGDKLEFFVEYTDHSIEHINKVLDNIEDLMTNDTLEKLNSLDSAILIVAVMLHDIGMKATIELFQNMLNGSYDYDQPGMPIEKNIYNDKSWIDLWEDYVKESQFWNEEKKINVIGESVYTVSSDDLRHKVLEDPNGLKGKDKRFIGEFIRRHHGRIAYEVAIRGYWGYNENRIVLNDALDEEYLQLAGMVARSHNMGLRENYNYLEKITDKTHYKSPYDIDIILHMVLIRLSDYLHIDKGRTNKIVLTLRKTYSPYSLKEHKKHLAITNINFKEKEETISIIVKSEIESAELFVGIEQLIRDIQSEFDTCWAVLGEQYSDKGYKLRYRRITSNLSHDGESSVRNTQKYVPKQFGFKFNNKLIELLIEPLYGKDPSFGVRELVQNAVDACRTRLAIDPNYRETTHVRVDLDTENKLFTIEDSGIGMTIDEIENYFLTIGSSYDSSIEWQKTRDAEGIYRTGHFGIGVLAAFLLGNKITVETRSIKSNQGYMFTVSLQDNFIQINKINNDKVGTKITIKCNESSFDVLEKAALDRIKSNKITSNKTIWTDWYVDDIPKVVYFINEKPIPICYNSSYFKNYRELKSKIEQMGVRYLIRERNGMPLYMYKPATPEERVRSLASIFINGFLITRESKKRYFNLQGLEKYYNFAYPSLYLNDTHNGISLNLQRSQIDESQTFPFEKELVEDMYKNLICRLLAIDISKILGHKTFLFNSTGFALNILSNYPFNHRRHYDNSDRFVRSYYEGFLLGKFIIHMGGVHLSKKNMDVWKELFALCPEAFFTFHDHEYDYLNRIHTVSTRKYFNRLTLAVNSSKEFEEFNNSIIENRENIKDDEILNSSFHKSPFAHIIKNNYYIYHRVGDDYDEHLVEKVLSFFQKEGIPEPAFILTHKIEGNNYQSDVDDFFEKYAGGDLIIPYEEVDRKIKFEEIYKECGRIIEQYKESYEQKPLDSI